MIASEASNSVLITTLILASIAPTLAALAGVIVSVINATKSRSEAKENKEQGQVIHNLVNSAMTEQKRLAAMFARRVADVTKNSKDIELAEQAEKIYNDAVEAAKAQ